MAEPTGAPAEVPRTSPEAGADAADAAAPVDLRDGSLVRGLKVLSAVTESGEVRAAEIAADVGMPLSTVYRYLRTLRQFDLIEERDGSYVPGWRLADLSGHDFVHVRLVEVGHSFLRAVSRATGESAVLMVRIGTNAMCLRQVESGHDEQLAFRINQMLPLYAGAGQRVLLAHAPESVVNRVLARPLRRITDRTPDGAALLRELEAIRAAGYATSYGEFSRSAVAVAVPVVVAGEVLCSLTVAGREERCGPAWVATARQHLAVAARQLAALLDDRPAAPPG